MINDFKKKFLLNYLCYLFLSNLTSLSVYNEGIILYEFGDEGGSLNNFIIGEN